MKRYLDYLFIYCFFFASIACTKKTDDLNGAGQTVILIGNAPENKVVFEPFTNKRKVEILELRRNVHNQEELNTSATVKLRLNQTLIADYNATNGSNFIELSPTVFRAFSKDVVLVGNEMTVTFAPGEFAKAVSVEIDGAKFDLTNSYALGLSVADAPGRVISATKQNVVVTFNVKNKWEGNYDVEGYFYHPTLPRALAQPKVLATAGLNSVKVDLGDLGAVGYVAIFTIDTATNAVTITPAPGAVGTPYTMLTAGLPGSNPGYTPAWARSADCNNRYDPATKTFYIRYGYVAATGWRVTEEIIKRK